MDVPFFYDSDHIRVRNMRVVSWNYDAFCYSVRKKRVLVLFLAFSNFQKISWISSAFAI